MGQRVCLTSLMPTLRPVTTQAYIVAHPDHQHLWRMRPRSLPARSFPYTEDATRLAAGTGARPLAHPWTIQSKKEHEGEQTPLLAYLCRQGPHHRTPTGTISWVKHPGWGFYQLLHPRQPCHSLGLAHCHSLPTNLAPCLRPCRANVPMAPPSCRLPNSLPPLIPSSSACPAHQLNPHQPPVLVQETSSVWEPHRGTACKTGGLRQVQSGALIHCPTCSRTATGIPQLSMTQPMPLSSPAAMPLAFPTDQPPSSP
jgi:hypothetical protein